MRINDAANERIFVSSTGEIGIRTTLTIPNITINATQASAAFGTIGVGVSILQSAVDFSDAGISTQRFMIPPRGNNAIQSGLQNLISGAIFYNTADNKLRVYNGSAWQDLN